MWNLNQDIENQFLPIIPLPPLDFTRYNDYILGYDLPEQESFLVDAVPQSEYYPNNDLCTLGLETLLPINQLPLLDFTSIAAHQSIQQSQLEKNIDVDQLVEQNKSTCTPQSSMSKLPPITQSIKYSHYVIHDESCLQPELCSICSHVLKLGTCPEAAYHLQEMKDMLITISNDSTHLEKIQQNRLELNKQIQQLKQYLCPNSEEKKNGMSSDNNSEQHDCLTKRTMLSKEVISQYYYLPINQAANELKVGVTLLKKRCRELGINCWPHRKLISLQTVIKIVQEFRKLWGEENEFKLKRAIELLEREMKLVEEFPDIELDDTTHRLRRVYFKAKFKKKKLMNVMESEEDAIDIVLSNHFSSNNLLF